MIGTVGFGYSLEQGNERLCVYGCGLSHYAPFPP